MVPWLGAGLNEEQGKPINTKPVLHALETYQKLCKYVLCVCVQVTVCSVIVCVQVTVCSVIVCVQVTVCSVIVCVLLNTLYVFIYMLCA